MPGRLAAWWRGVVTTIARARGQRCRLSLAVMQDVDLPREELSSTLILEVTNIGREPVVVSGIALRRRSATEEYCFSTHIFPKLLEPNDSVIAVFDCPRTVLTDAEGLCAYDSRGIKWQLPKKQFKKLLKRIRSN